MRFYIIGMCSYCRIGWEMKINVLHRNIPGSFFVFCVSIPSTLYKVHFPWVLIMKKYRRTQKGHCSTDNSYYHSVVLITL